MQSVYKLYNIDYNIFYGNYSEHNSINLLFFSQKYTKYIYYQEEKEDDTELKVDDMGYDFDHEDEDKLLNRPELTK